MEKSTHARSELTVGLLPSTPLPAIDWRISDGLTSYEEALAEMTARAGAIARGDAPELVWLLEHAPLYTAGTSAQPDELIEARFPVHKVGRGGQFTYHGPGQRVGYVMLDLKRRAPDVRRFVATLEEWIIRTLAAFNVRGEGRRDRVGVWVRRPDKGPGFEDKIAAIGVRVQRWVTLHGFAVNVEPDLSHFSGIVPCGVSEGRYGVTSLADLGCTASLPDFDTALRTEFTPLFGAIADAQAQRNFVRRRLTLIDRLDARTGRAALAYRDHRGDIIPTPAEQRLDRAVVAVANPTFYTALKCGDFGPSAIAHTLHTAADHNAPMHPHGISPMSRCSLRCPAPSGCLRSQRCNEPI